MSPMTPQMTNATPPSSITGQRSADFTGGASAGRRPADKPEILFIRVEGYGRAEARAARLPEHGSVAALICAACEPPQRRR